GAGLRRGSLRPSSPRRGSASPRGMSASPDLAQFLRTLAYGPGLLPSMDVLEAVIASGAPRRIQTLNLQHLDLYERDEEFREAVRRAGAWSADGWPVQLALRRLGVRSTRVTGRELCERLARAASFAPSTPRAALLGAGYPA